MASMNDYPINFVKRTKTLLENDFEYFKEKEQEVTFLLNCLLGLIVTVSENEEHNKTVFEGYIDDVFLKLIPDKIKFFLENKSVTNPNKLKEKTQAWFIKKIRNAIAHQHIDAINDDDGKWVGVSLWNENNKSIKNFEIIFNIEELKKFAIEISEIYIKKINEQST